MFLYEQGLIFSSIRIDPSFIKDWSFAHQGLITIKKNLWKNIPSRINPSKARIDPYLSVTVSLRFSRYEHLRFCAKYRSLWDRLKVSIFLKIFKKAKTIFKPKHVFSSIFQIKTDCWIKSISTIGAFYK